MDHPAQRLLGKEVPRRFLQILGGQRLPFPGTPSGALRGRIGGPVTVGIRAEHLSDAAAAPGRDAVLHATVARVEHLGSENFLHLRMNGHRLVTLTSPDGQWRPGRRGTGPDPRRDHDPG